jgi:hypothetical protein
VTGDIKTDCGALLGGGARDPPDVSAIEAEGEKEGADAGATGSAREGVSWIGDNLFPVNSSITERLTMIFVSDCACPRKYACCAAAGREIYPPRINAIHNIVLI